METLNKNQKAFLDRLIYIEPLLLKTFNGYLMSETAKLAMLILDPEGWLFDDMIVAIKDYLETLGQNENVQAERR
jgi:hypothetical protein